MAIRKSSTSGVPFGNTANRPANPTVGQTYYNGELGYQEIYTNAGWIPAAGGNDFNLNITSAYTTVTFSQSFAGGSYSIVSSGNDSTIDIYAYASDGSLAGYTATKAFTATQRFNKMVIIGGTNGDVLSFSYKTTFATSATTSETAAGPFITAVSPSAMPNVNDTITITGGNFANNVQVAFTGSGYSSTQAKNIVRSSASSLIVTRPDNFPPSASPYTITITNPGVSAPAATLANISSNSITAGVGPVWNTAATLPTFTRNVAYSTVLSATDSDAGGSITYSLVSGSLPTGLTLSSLTGGISGTPTSDLTATFTIRATDAGQNFVDRTFTMPNAGPVWSTAATLPTFTRNVAYSTTVVATDDSGNAPTYSLVSGSLPIGLSLSSAGVISGTPTSATQVTVTIRATDANGNTADRAFTMPNAGPVWSTSTLTQGVRSISYSQQVSAVDDSGISPTYSVASGALPTGLSMSASGLITGTPSVNGSGTVTLRASDANGSATDRSFSWSVIEPPIGGTLYSSTGTYTFTVPANVYSVHVVAIGPGGKGGGNSYNGGAGGGGLGYKNNISVTPGQTITVRNGLRSNSDSTQGESSFFSSESLVCGRSGFSAPTTNGTGGAGGTFTGDGGGNGGKGGDGGSNAHWGGGGAAGYGGNGGRGNGTDGGASSGAGGGGGGGGTGGSGAGYRGGGVGVYGQGADGGGSNNGPGGDGSGGSGGVYGAGGGAQRNDEGRGAVRIIWGAGRSFPSTNVGQNYSGVTETVV